jgi:hypothetical protein
MSGGFTRGTLSNFLADSLCIPGESPVTLFVCVAGITSDAGLMVRPPVVASTGADVVSPSILLLDGGRYSFNAHDRRWILRHLQGTEPPAEKEGGLLLVSASFTGNQKFRGAPQRWGLILVNVSCSKVFSVKL